MMAVKRVEARIRKEKDVETSYKRIKRIGKGAFGSVDLVMDNEGKHSVMKAITLAGLGPRERGFALQEVEVFADFF